MSRLGYRIIGKSVLKSILKKKVEAAPEKLVLLCAVVPLGLIELGQENKELQ